jgi:hypothetical protein
MKLQRWMQHEKSATSAFSAILFAIISVPLCGLACEPAAPHGNLILAKPVLQEALITTSSGITHKCAVANYAIHDGWWFLKCANGSEVTVGMESKSPTGFPTYALVRDREGGLFKMNETLKPGWRNFTCSRGLAIAEYNYQLSQQAFGFDLIILVGYAQKKPAQPPAGF